MFGRAILPDLHLPHTHNTNKTDLADYVNRMSYPKCLSKIAYPCSFFYYDFVVSAFHKHTPHTHKHHTHTNTHTTHAQTHTHHTCTAIEVLSWHAHWLSTKASVNSMFEWADTMMSYTHDPIHCQHKQ